MVFTFENPQDYVSHVNRSTVCETREPVCETRERYADVVVYDRKTCLNVIVVEVKGSDQPCEAQNNEQMVGLWGKEQLCMLGLEVKDGKVLPKVLSLEDKTMKMYFLEELDLETETATCTAFAVYGNHCVIHYIYGVLLTAFYFLFMHDHP